MIPAGQSLLAVTLLLAAAWPAAAAPAKVPGKPAAALSLRSPMVFYLAQGEPNVCGAGCDEWIAAEGEITKGTADRMRAFLKRQGASKRPIYFNSPGGVTSESLEMGRLMRERGMTARVARTIPLACDSEGSDCAAAKRSGRPLAARLTSSQAQCNSACVYAIVGARLREIAPEAHLGIHASKTVIMGLPKNVIIPAETRARFKAENQQRIRRYLVAMGIPSTLLDAAEKIPHESVHALSREEMVQFNIDTRHVVESGWIYDERISGSGSNSSNIFKSIDMAETGSAAYRKTILRLSCRAGEFLLGYIREIGPQETSFASMRLVAASKEFELPPPAGSVASDDAKHHYDVRFVRVPVNAFEVAATADRIEIAPGEGKPAIARLSTAGLASALSSLSRHCDQESPGGAALVPRQSP